MYEAVLIASHTLAFLFGAATTRAFTLYEIDIFLKKKKRKESP